VIVKEARGFGRDLPQLAVMGWGLECEMESKSERSRLRSSKLKMSQRSGPHDWQLRMVASAANLETLRGYDEPIFHELVLPERG
jgi:hypothetical protein